MLKQSLFPSFVLLWLDSLSSFRLESLKLLFLVTLKSFIELNKALYHGLLVLLPTFISISILGKFYPSYAYFLHSLFLITTVIYGARSSIDYKNIVYWFNFLSFFIKALFITIALWIITKPLIVFLEYSLGIPFNILFFPFILLVCLFLADEQPNYFSIAIAIKNGALMFLYNMPFFLAIYTLFIFFVILLEKIFIGLPSIFFILYILSGIFYILYISNFYIKRVHEQFSLYYKQAQS